MTILPVTAMAGEGETAVGETASVIASTAASSVWDGTTADTSWYNSDSQTKAYTITTAAQLAGLAALVNAGTTAFSKWTITLGTNIDLGGHEWAPIGGTDTGKEFAGTFEGNDYTISNLKITKGSTNTAENNSVGLFGACTSAAKLQNFTLHNVDVSGSLNVAAVLGGSGVAEAKITNVHVTGSVRVSGWWYVGGILGKGYSTVTNCSVEGDGAASSYVSITGGYAGGIVGYMGEDNCVTTGCTVKDLTVSGAYNGIGGVNGILHYGNTISDCTVEDVVVWQTTEPEASDNGRIFCGAFAGTYLDNNGKNCPTLSGCIFTGELYNGPEKTNILEATRYVGSLWYGSEPPATVNIENCTIYMPPVAQIGDKSYQTLEAAVTEAAPGATIELLKNVDLTECLELEKSVTIQGNDHTITNTANRIIRLTQPDLDVKIYDCQLISKCTDREDVRGISFDDVTSGSSLLLDGCSLSASFYAINIVTGPTNLSVTIKNGSVAAGWAAINSYSNNSTFTIENSQLTGLNDKGESRWNNFATIVFDGWGFSTFDNIGKYGSNNTVRILNSTVEASTESSNSQDWLSLQYGATGNNVYVDSASQIVDRSGNDVSEAVYVSFRTGTSVNPGTTYNPKHLICVQKNAEIYQIWAPAGDTITLPDAPGKIGYNFAGWSDGTKVYSAGGSYIMPEANTATFTAQWTAIPSGGGSSSGGSSGNKTETEKNPDGSTTTTVTKPDGSTTETTKQPNGSTTTVASDKNGNVETTVKLPGAVVTEAAEKGEAVSLPMDSVKVSGSSNDASPITVDLPSGTSAKVKIPVRNVSAGTVAILVKADGTEQVIKTSVTTENGVALTVEDGATVKIVDNAKDFADVSADYWAADAIDFATSRELFAGTSETTFTPVAPMTRAMIVTVLARYSSDAPSSEIGYAEGQQWAVETGVSDGSNMSGTITRQQLATMLYRYAGSPVVTGDLSAFPDASSVSDYAKDALSWAVEEGLIGGMTDGSLNPFGLATRAQVATILMRFVAASN